MNLNLLRRKCHNTLPIMYYSLAKKKGIDMVIFPAMLTFKKCVQKCVKIKDLSLKGGRYEIR